MNHRKRFSRKWLYKESAFDADGRAALESDEDNVMVPVISEESIDANPGIAVTHKYLNDNTIAGIEVVGKPIFSVQYHPEASAGPHDSRYLFDQFIENMKLAK